MKEPDYEKLLQQAESCKAGQPLVAHLANAIRTLMTMNKSLEAVNFLWIEKWNSAESDWSHMRQRALAAEAHVDRMAKSIEAHARKIEDLQERVNYPYDKEGNFVP